MQNVYDFCAKCFRMCRLIEKLENGTEPTEKEMEDIRYRCQYCRSFGRNGIYKADAILTALKEKRRAKNNLTPGRKPVREKQYGKAIINLRKEGKTIREISEILGISKTTVHKIVKKHEL